MARQVKEQEQIGARYRLDPVFERLSPRFNTAMAETANAQDELVSKAVVIWNGTVVDGIALYMERTARNIPYMVRNLWAPNKNSAIIAICKIRLENRFLTTEFRTYVLGTLFNTECILNGLIPGERTTAINRTNISDEIGKQYGISGTTVLKYGEYAEAINKIWNVEPTFIEQVLSGQFRISQDNLILLATKSKGEILQVITMCEGKSYFSAKELLSSSKDKPNDEEKVKKQQDKEFHAKVKDMPKKDPDVAVMSLKYTIPSWISSLDRIAETSDIATISNGARRELQKSLIKLNAAVIGLMGKLEAVNGNE